MDGAVRFIARGDRQDGAGWVELYDGDSYEAAIEAACEVHADTELAHVDCLDAGNRPVMRVI